MKEGSWKCECSSGSTSDGFECTDIDECVTNSSTGKEEFCFTCRTVDVVMSETKLSNEEVVKFFQSAARKVKFARILMEVTCVWT